MVKRFTASEIAAMNLPGLPTTKKAILTRAEKEEWFYETKVGLGGMRKMFEIPAAYLPGYQPYKTEPNTQAPLVVSESTKVAGAIMGGEQVNTERLASAIRALDEYLLENNLTIEDAARKAEIVTFLYKFLEKKVGAGEITDLLRLVTK